jgi:hypothetical protein
MLQHFHCLKSRLLNSSNGGYSTRSRSHHNNLRHLHRNYQAFPQSRRTWPAQPTSRNPGAITISDVSSKRKITIFEKSSHHNDPPQSLSGTIWQAQATIPQSISPHYPTPPNHVLPRQQPIRQAFSPWECLRANKPTSDSAKPEKKEKKRKKRREKRREKKREKKREKNRPLSS